MRVLDGVSFELRPGEWLGMTGANGAGKTTLLKILAGLLSPSSGTVRIGDYDVVRQRREATDHVGYVLTDDRSFHWRLTARENLEFFAALDGLRQREARLRVEELLQKLDLQQAADRRVAQLSSGMRQRLGIARGLLQRPRVLLLDEPTRSIDDSHARDTWEVLHEEVASVDGCVVLVTHQISEIAARCDRVAVLAEGRLLLRDSSELAETELVAATVLYVQHLDEAALAATRAIRGVGELRVLTQAGAERVLELRSIAGPVPLAAVIHALTAGGATVTGLDEGQSFASVVDAPAPHIGTTRP